MTKRYQVFVSSTYEDLIDERLEVMKALLELDCIPCGMEYFPAANEDQWTFIKKLIDTCDYYIVIVGGRYGSEDIEGISYTQKEYEYALSKEIPTIGFIHHNRTSLSSDKKDVEEEKLKKLDDFIALVRSKLCKDWRNAYELGAFVSRSLTQLMKSNPRIGWVRADKIGSEELLGEVNSLRKENQVLKVQILKLEAETAVNIDTSNIAFEDPVEVNGTYTYSDVYSGRTMDSTWVHKTTWKALFVIISPHLLKWTGEQTVQTQFATSILNQTGKRKFWSETIDSDIFQTIKVQFLALGLIQTNTLNTVGGGTGFFWSLTQKGKSIMLQERSVKKRNL